MYKRQSVYGENKKFPLSEKLKLDKPIKELGAHNVSVKLHPEVQAIISVIASRTDAEAETLIKGEEITQNKLFSKSFASTSFLMDDKLSSVEQFKDHLHKFLKNYPDLICLLNMICVRPTATLFQRCERYSGKSCLWRVRATRQHYRHRAT